MGKNSIGRNDPCHCGSGKKYKKCCLEKDEATDAVERAARSTVAPVGLSSDDLALRNVSDSFETPESDTSGGFGGAFEYEKIVFNPEVDWKSRQDRRGIALAPYTWARRWDSSAYLKSLPSTERVSRQDVWSPGVIRSWETGALEEKLVAAGFPYERSAFLAALAGLESAWEASEPWLAAVPGADERLREFAGLAACELWRRLAPERPSLEMIDDWIVEGYEWSASVDSEPSMKAWIRAWDALRPKFTPVMRSLEDGHDRVFGGRSQNLPAWMQYFARQALEWAADDPRSAIEGLRVFEEVFQVFPDAGSDLDLRGQWGLMQMRCGDRQTGIGTLERLIADAPDRAVGYVDLAEELAFDDNKSTAEDVDRAVRLLEQALAYPVKDADEWDIADRLADIQIVRDGDLSKIPWSIPIQPPPKSKSKS